MIIRNQQDILINVLNFPMYLQDLCTIQLFRQTSNQHSFLCVSSCVPFSSSEFLGSLGVDGHGPVHTAGEAFLQQEFCYVAILTQREIGTVRRTINDTESLNFNGTCTIASVLPGEGWCPV